MTREKPSPISHEQAETLLPWFVNGTLAKAEHALVSAHAENCLSCRRAIQREQRLRSLMAAEPMANSAVDPGFRRLMRRVETQARVKVRRAMLPDADLTRSTWGYAAMMFVALGVAIWLAKPRQTLEPDANYTTVTDPQPLRDLVDVVFAADLDTATRSELVDAVGGRVVAGPSEVGRYTIELMPGESVDAIVARLRSDNRVVFAGRSYADLDRSRDTSQ